MIGFTRGLKERIEELEEKFSEFTALQARIQQKFLACEEVDEDAKQKYLECIVYEIREAVSSLAKKAIARR